MVDEFAKYQVYVTSLLIASSTLLAVAPVFLAFVHRQGRAGRILSYSLLVSFLAGLLTITFILDWLYFQGARPLYRPILSFLIQILAFTFSAGALWTGIAEEGRQTQKRRERTDNQEKTDNTLEQRHLQNLLTQRLLIFLATSSILLLASISASDANTILKASLLGMGLFVSLIGVIHFWFKKNDLNQLDPPKGGLRKFIKGRWVGIYLSAAFCAIWVTLLVQLLT